MDHISHASDGNMFDCLDEIFFQHCLSVSTVRPIDVLCLHKFSNFSCLQQSRWQGSLHCDSEQGLTRYSRATEQTELERRALVCCCSRRRTQQVHHRAAWTRGQGNSRRGCHCSLAGHCKIPEAHQRPITGRGGISYPPKISWDCHSLGEIYIVHTHRANWEY